MQIPPHTMLMPRHLRRTQTDESKYVRAEFGDKDPAWFTADVARRSGCADKVPEPPQNGPACGPGDVCAVNGRAAEY